MHDAGAPAQSLELKPPTLDDVFLELTGRSLREGADALMLGQATREEAALKEAGPSDQVLRDTWYVFWREMLLPLRDPFSLVFSLLQPLVFLGLFGPLLGFGRGSSGLRRPVHAAVVPARRRGHDCTVRHVHDRIQPAVRADDRLLRADPGHATVPLVADDRAGAEGVGAAGGAGPADRGGVHSLRLRLLSAARAIRAHHPGHLRHRTRRPVLFAGPGLAEQGVDFLGLCSRPCCSR